MGRLAAGRMGGAAGATVSTGTRLPWVGDPDPEAARGRRREPRSGPGPAGGGSAPVPIPVWGGTAAPVTTGVACGVCLGPVGRVME